ncbi:MAG: hypothetical protein ACOYMA_14620 [Bacteroidia bacterium]
MGKKNIISIILLFLLSLNVVGQLKTTKTDTLLIEIKRIESELDKQKIIFSETICKLDSVYINKDSVCLYINSYCMCDCNSKSKNNEFPWQIIITIITAIFVLIQINYNNITQSRIRLIEDLKKNISKYIGLMNSINIQISDMIDEEKDSQENASNNPIKEKEIFDNNYKNISNDIKKSDFLINQIRLSFVGNRFKHKKLIEKLIEFTEKAKKSFHQKEIEDFDIVKNECIELSFELLKEKWNRILLFPFIWKKFTSLFSNKTENKNLNV